MPQNRPVRWLDGERAQRTAPALRRRTGEELLRTDLTEEAILARILHRLLPGGPRRRRLTHADIGIR